MPTTSAPSSLGRVPSRESWVPPGTNSVLMRGEVVEEKTLVEALRAGHEWAFEAMVRQFGGRLLSVARRLTHNDEDARDVVQSAYLSAFRALSEFESACQLSTWLHRIVVNTALMKLRSRRRKPEESIEVLLPAFQADGHHVEQFSDWGAPADRLLEQKEARATVRACIQQLPQNYREVLMLRDIEELSTQEVADALSMTPTAVKVRLHRARQALSTLLRNEYARSSVTSLPSRHPTGIHAGRSLSVRDPAEGAPA
jgi:RNA polymerase sigma-70 factor, ECF subfamily